MHTMFDHSVCSHMMREVLFKVLIGTPFVGVNGTARLETLAEYR